MLYMQHNEAGTVSNKMHMIQQNIKIRGPRIDGFLRELCRNENHSGRRFPDLRIFKGQHIEHMKVRFMIVYVLSRAVGIATNTMALYDEVPPYLIE